MAARTLVLLNAVVVVALWVHGGGLHDQALTSLGRLSGLLGAYLALVELVFLPRGPRSSVWHRYAGHAVLWLLLAHTVLVTLGYARDDRTSLFEQLRRLIEEFPGLITAFAALAVLIVVAIASALRRRLRYETWYFIHLYTYLAVVLGFSHQLATGTAFVGDTAARAYWYALYAAALVLVPARLARVRLLRVERVVPVAPGIVNVELAGSVRAKPGQFFRWRFLTRGRWFEAHPFSLSAVGRARITVKGVGDFTRGLGSVAPGTRVLAEGPYGAFTARGARGRPLMIAGGVGITPIRALLEELPADVIYVAPRAEDVVLREELEALADSVTYVVGRQDIVSLVDDIASRDVYLCGPPEMVDALSARLREAGVRRLITERFEL
jgi:predicted ferric reductase